MSRWDRLFDDLEAQLAADESRGLRAEVADRTRRERALVGLTSRLVANVGSTVVLRLVTGTHEGEVRDVGADWLLLEVASQRPLLVSLRAVRSVSGLRAGAHEQGLVARSLALGAALRALSRDRAVVELTDVDGHVLTGTLDAVASDHVELAEHPVDEPRRTANVRAIHLVPFEALATVARAVPGWQ